MATQLLSLVPESRTSPSNPAPKIGGNRRIYQALQEIDGLVDSVLASWQRSGTMIHGRRWHRVAYSKEISVTALGEGSEQPVAEPIDATGREISIEGISFSHAVPLPHRLVAVTLELADGSFESIVTALKWCRFGRDGRYYSGGHFLRAFAAE